MTSHDLPTNEISPEVQRVWDEHWWPIVSKDGSLDLDQIKRELADYATLLDNVSEVYCYVTGGVASKPFILPSVINGLHDEYVNQQIEEVLQEERAVIAPEYPGRIDVPSNHVDALLDAATHWESAAKDLLAASRLLRETLQAQTSPEDYIAEHTTRDRRGARYRRRGNPFGRMAAVWVATLIAVAVLG